MTRSINTTREDYDDMTDDITMSTEQQAQTAETAMPIDAERVKKFLEILQKYKAGKARTEKRIKDAEQWWKLRNTMQEQETSQIGKDGGFASESGWLHNVITSKHADAMEAYPEANILPREQSDRAEATTLSAIIPCVLEQNGFEQTYSDAQWQKCKYGTGIYKIVWDSSKLNGLGDIGIERVNPLNVFWQPGVTDIQRSRYFFHVELHDKDLLAQQYPQLADKLGGQNFLATKFLYDDSIDTSDMATVVDVYYRKLASGKMTLQYCKFVGDEVLYATENDPQNAERGLYDHGKYPYVFDALFPIEGSPCGYGYVDICKNPQTAIDLMDTAFIKNSMVGATPRYFRRTDSGVNEQQFLDLAKPLVDVGGNIGEDALRQIPFDPLPSVYVNYYDRKIQELRETSGNTETSTGNVSSGVTAASAIAALQEAAGKGSRDSCLTSYRAFTEIVGFVIELIRQFYDLPRKFRIIGDGGAEQYIAYNNSNLKPTHQGVDFGRDMGYRMPVFDIKTSAQKKNAYTKITQNELAIQFFQLGFFRPQMVDEALACLQMMDFDGKDGLMQSISKNGTLFQKLVRYMQLAITFAQAVRPDMVQALVQDYQSTVGAEAAGNISGAVQSLATAGLDGGEHPRVRNARKKATAASQPDGGAVTAEASEN